MGQIVNMESPFEFLFEFIGRHVSSEIGAAMFLKKPVPYVTVKNPNDGMQRLGSCGDVYLMASPDDSVIVAPLIGIANTSSFRVIRKAAPTRNAERGRWLWTVAAPFLMAEQGKASVESNLRISRSLRGGIYCTSSGQEAFDLVMCREIATAVLDAGMSKQYSEMQMLRRKLAETPYDEESAQALFETISKKIKKLNAACPALEGVPVLWPDTMESRVVRWLIEAREAENV